MKEFIGRVAVITGAAGGIGRAIALRFAAERMRLVLADIDVARLDETAAFVRKTGAGALAVPTDVADAASMNRLAEAALQEYGGVHILCNNAGVSRIGLSWEMPLDDWNWVFDIDFWGVLHGIRAFLPHILAQSQGGHIVNTASVGGLMTAPYVSPYAAAKHAVIGLSKSLRRELYTVDPSIGVTVLCPGTILTGMDPNTSRPGAPVDDLDPGLRAVLGSWREDANTGMPPEDVAEMTLTAIRDNQFFVLPNVSEYLPVLRAEAADVLTAPTEPHKGHASTISNEHSKLLND
jgi:NAD(P)-dependent dehydrogenase (short-subunit alcohol dehydrogenase family)